MRTPLAVLVLVGFVAASVPNGVADPLAAPEGPPQNHWIVAFRTLPALAPGGTHLGERVVSVTPGLDFAVLQVKDPQAFHQRALADGNVRYVEWDDPAYATLSFVPNDAKYNDPGHWGSKKIGAEAAWDATRGSTAVKVAMVDSGLHKAHEEFSGQARVLQGHDFANNDNDPADEGLGCGYHGTHTAGTAGATIHNNKGIAGLSQHSILPVKALKINIPLIIYCSGSTSALANWLKYAGDQGAHISSNSWGGGGSSTTLNSAISYAHDRGVTHVAAAGNDGSCTNCVGQPWKANPSKVIVVSCTTSTDAFCSFSSEGPEVDVAAPGQDIISSCGSGTTSYCTYDGTSMSAPHVAGTLALVKALNPSFGYAELDQRITETALDLGASGKDDKFGHGRIRANLAVV
jgi:subtilisin family serine protease